MISPPKTRVRDDGRRTDYGHNTGFARVEGGSAPASWVRNRGGGGRALSRSRRTPLAPRNRGHVRRSRGPVGTNRWQPAILQLRRCPGNGGTLRWGGLVRDASEDLSGCWRGFSWSPLTSETVPSSFFRRRGPPEMRDWNRGWRRRTGPRLRKVGVCAPKGHRERSMRAPEGDRCASNA